MINTDMRQYNYYTFGKVDEYGQPTISDKPEGTIKIAINTSSQSIQDNILYKNSSYIGLTHDAGVNDKYIIDYNGNKLKVLYVTSIGRFKQVFMAGM